jgi:chorismate mutase / prephenate dehydratase
MHLNPGPLSPSALRNIFREIISAAREVQMPFGVAFLGPEATFSHLAALKKFGRATRFGPMTTIQEVFAEVEKGKFNTGWCPSRIPPKASSTISMDLFAETSVRICGEIYLEVSHDLVSKSGQRADIEVIYTHPQAHGQCRRWLGTHLGEIPILEVASTGVAAQKAAKNPNAAAIASAFAAPCMTCGWWSPASKITRQRHPFLCHRARRPRPHRQGQDLHHVRGGQHPGGPLQNPAAPGGAEPQHDPHRLPAGPKTRPGATFSSWTWTATTEPQVGQALEEVEAISAHFKLLGSFPKAAGWRN